MRPCQFIRGRLCPQIPHLRNHEIWRPLGDFGVGRHNLAHKTVGKRLFGAHPVIPVRVLLDLLKRLAGGRGEYLVQPLAHPDNFARLDLHVGGLAANAAAGFVPLRKKGKLPHHVITESYELEYGVDSMEMHTDAIASGDRVLLVDDLIATGGTAMAAVKLLRKAGAKIAGAAFLVCLPELQGDTKLAGQGINVSYLVWFAGH